MHMTQTVQKIGQVLIVALPIKKGVSIFRDFAADKDFVTYHMLLVGVKLP